MMGGSPGEASVDVIERAERRARAWNDPALFTTAVPLELGGDHARPLGGGPLSAYAFVVKDNFDLEGLPTTAGCPDFGSLASATSPAARALLEAGAHLLGRVNMDQFATGLNGTRSPHGTPRNPLDPDRIPGGSSSGSAAAVAASIVDFALGTDTAGSGRVPAAMTQTVGLKPSRGIVSTSGVVPACASLDCVSVHARSVELAWTVFEVLRASGADETCRQDRTLLPLGRIDELVVGVPDRLDEVDGPIKASFQRMINAMESQGITTVPLDFSDLYETGELLYGGPFVAERTASVGGFVAASPDAVQAITRQIIQSGDEWTAAELHTAQMTVRRLASRVQRWWDEIDLIAVPSVPTAPTLDEMARDPLALNTRLGRFTSFTNLLDLCAITIPDPDHPFAGAGCTLQGPARSDRVICGVASQILTGQDLTAPACADGVEIVVAGAHLRGEARNGDLVRLGGRLVERTTTGPDYRMWVLSDGRRPAIAAVGDGGCPIEVEVWALPGDAVGEFLKTVEAPLGIGRVTLAAGEEKLGFICEPGALEGATEITGDGGWRQWRARIDRANDEADEKSHGSQM